MGDAVASCEDARPTFRRHVPARGGPGDNLARYLVRHDAATKIQKSFRRYQNEQSLRRRSFCKFGEEAVDLIKRYTEADGRLEEETFASKARLVLHFDVNKTIIMTDKAKNEGVDFIVNSLLSDCAWGRLEPGPVWVPVGRLATDRPAADVQLMTYRSYLDSFLLPFEAGASAAAQARNADRKARRQALKRRFTEAGQPGRMFRGVFEQLRRALVLPPGPDSRSELFRHGNMHILSSFFNLLIHLQNQRREFVIIFRTFGEDLPAVIEEMDLFCTGRHPHYPGVRMDGSDGRTDLRLRHADSLGIYHRATTKPDGSCLLIGPADKLLPLARRGVSRRALEDAASAGDGFLLRSFGDIHAHYLGAAERENRAFAICDFYPFWKSRNERSHAGKPFLLDPSDRSALKIFFDDNIGYTTAHIVDARDVRTGAPLPFQSLIKRHESVQDVAGVHMLKVEPLNAILDPHYFVRALHECVVAWLRSGAQDAGGGGGPRASPGARRWRSVDGGTGGREGRQTVANTSRRARDLWSVLTLRVVAFVRLKRALLDSA